LYIGTEQITLSGQVYPAPQTGSNEMMQINVNAASGTVVATANALPSYSNGYFSMAIQGGNSAWTDGTYYVHSYYRGYIGTNTFQWRRYATTNSSTSSSTTIWSSSSTYSTIPYNSMSSSSSSTTSMSTVSSASTVPYSTNTPTYSTYTTMTSTTVPYYNIFIGPTEPTYTGIRIINLMGTVHPPPSTSAGTAYNASVAVYVKSPSGAIVVNLRAPVSSTGAFSLSFQSGTNTGWKNGTYAITSVFSGAVGTNTFGWYGVPLTNSAGTTTITSVTSYTTTATTLNTALTTITVKPVLLNYSGNNIYPSSLPQVNSVSASAIPGNIERNVSTSIGVPIATMANSISTPLNSNSLTFGCMNCNANYANATPQNNIIVGFVGNGTTTTVVNTIELNATLLNHIENNHTPSGFVPDLSSGNVTMRNATGYSVQWAAVGNESNSVADISAINKAFANASETSSIPLSDRAAFSYAKEVFNNTDIVNVTKTQVVHVEETVSNNNTRTRYTPTSITTYQSADAAVVSFSNLPSGVDNKVQISKSNLPIKTISFSSKDNLTTSAIAVKVYSSNYTSAGAGLPAPPGNVANYFSVNSTISDSRINSVNYTFNVTQAWLSESRINPLSLSLYRLNATTNTWTRLHTVLVAANATAYVYSARSPGMSFYAISSSPFNITTANSAITIVPQTVNNTFSNSTVDGSTPMQFDRFTLVLFVSLAIIFVILYFYFRPPFRPGPTEAKMDRSAVDYS
jgi:PGF-pre-PGF domain-containing protein